MEHFSFPTRFRADFPRGQGAWLGHWFVGQCPTSPPSARFSATAGAAEGTAASKEFSQRQELNGSLVQPGPTPLWSVCCPSGGSSAQPRAHALAVPLLMPFISQPHSTSSDSSFKLPSKGLWDSGHLPWYSQAMARALSIMPPLHHLS